MDKAMLNVCYIQYLVFNSSRTKAVQISHFRDFFKLYLFSVLHTNEVVLSLSTIFDCLIDNKSKTAKIKTPIDLPSSSFSTCSDTKKSYLHALRQILQKQGLGSELGMSWSPIKTTVNRCFYVRSRFCRVFKVPTSLKRDRVGLFSAVAVYIIAQAFSRLSACTPGVSTWLSPQAPLPAFTETHRYRASLMRHRCTSFTQ